MSLQIRQSALAGVVEIIPQRHADERGVFCETWSAERFREWGFDLDFVQDNHSISGARGVLRGLHYQLAPHAQDKLIRVIRGAIFDVAVDIRPLSPTFGAWVGVELSAEKWNQLLVPKGYAHGFVTLEPSTEVLYKVTHPYTPSHERGIRFDDPQLAIAWPIDHGQIQLADKDRHAPSLAEAELGQVPA
ncbi:MAG: dTDP-4-dehydrorhamnose 3,5-epimerase [Devosia sp.]|nr:dTDP-4-dehydrorhamnose 3,5-epimerase [Devosia sp.]